MPITEPPSRPTPSTSPDDRAVVRLRSPGDLLTVLPYHLGYVPERSLVVLTLRGRSLYFVGRVDLPPRTTAGREAAAALLVPLSRHRFDRALVVTVEDALVVDPDRGDGVDGLGAPGALRSGAAERQRAAPRSWTDLAREVCAGLRAIGVEVDERIVVRDGMWWCPDGRARERRPQRLPSAGEVPAVAEFVGRGRVPLRHRDDLTGLLRGTPRSGAAAAAVDDLVARFTEGGADRPTLRRRAVAAWARLVAEDPTGGPDRRPRRRGAAPPSATGDDPDTDLLLASLHDVPLRDLVLSWLCPDDGRLDQDERSTGSVEPGPVEDVLTGREPADRVPGDPETVALARALGPGPERERGDLVAALTRLCRACPPGRGAPALAVLAHVAWWHGDGSMARVAVDAALEQDPHYSLAALLGQLLDLAVAPRHVA